jgi:hypothetical protein
MSGVVLSFVKSTDYWTISKTYSFVDAFTGQVVVTASKDMYTFPWTWNIKILNTSSTSPIVNPSLLGLVFAHSSFSETDSDGNDVTDVCNQYFFFTCILDGIATFGLIAFVLYFYGKKMVDKGHECWNNAKTRRVTPIVETSLEDV